MKVGPPHGPTMLKLAVLAVAEKNPVSGKAFAAKVMSLTQGWRISPGLVYPLLASMEKEGLLECGIAAPKGKGRRELVYSLTPKGKLFLKKARSKSREHVAKIMSRMMPLAAFVCFGDDDPEFLELVKQARTVANERIWRAAALGKEARLRELKKIIRAVQTA